MTAAAIARCACRGVPRTATRSSSTTSRAHALTNDPAPLRGAPGSRLVLRSVLVRDPRDRVGTQRREGGSIASLELLGPLGCGIQTGAGGVLNVLRPPAGST